MQTTDVESCSLQTRHLQPFQKRFQTIFCNCSVGNQRNVYSVSCMGNYCCIARIICVSVQTRNLQTCNQTCTLTGRASFKKKAGRCVCGGGRGALKLTPLSKKNSSVIPYPPIRANSCRQWSTFKSCLGTVPRLIGQKYLRPHPNTPAAAITDNPIPNFYKTGPS